MWEDRSLHGWLTNPDDMVPDNEMPFDGIKNASERGDLLAFLKEVTKRGAAPQQNAQAQMGGKGGMMGMGGMMGGGGDSNLEGLDPARQVKAITYCHDSYRVITANRKTRHFWERNLRFMTDSSKDGPGRTRDHAGRHAGRSRRRDFRHAGRDHQDDRSAMLSHAAIF
jgi:cytochrome c